MRRRWRRLAAEEAAGGVGSGECRGPNVAPPFPRSVVGPFPSFSSRPAGTTRTGRSRSPLLSRALLAAPLLPPPPIPGLTAAPPPPPQSQLRAPRAARGAPGGAQGAPGDLRNPRARAGPRAASWRHTAGWGRSRHRPFRGASSGLLDPGIPVFRPSLAL